ncbi:MAG: hypothetical protein WB919_02250 [Candidatus Sulfotelmatobacter sp.]
MKALSGAGPVEDFFAVGLGAAAMADSVSVSKQSETVKRRFMREFLFYVAAKMGEILAYGGRSANCALTDFHNAR